MPRPDINRTAEMEVFARVVALAGFSAAARSLRMTPSAVSKLVARLEARLGTRLFNRSTRKLQLTAEGHAFHERCRRILVEIEEAEREAAAGATPRGPIRVNASVSFGRLYLLPLVPAFLERHPGVTLDIALSDQVIDLMAERADVAIRVGPLRASGLVARKLGESGVVVVGAPSYLARRGTPRSVADLAAHNMIGFDFARSLEGWPFRDGARIVTVPVVGNVRAGDGETSRELAVAGVGLARHARFHVGPDITAGRLVPVLEALNPGDTEAIHAVYLGQGGYLPSRIRAFIDYLAATVRVG